VWFKAPLASSTVSGQLNGGTACYVNGTGVTRVAFSLDSTALNTDTTMSDGMQCVLDTTKFANGTHSLKATAYDASGKLAQRCHQPQRPECDGHTDADDHNDVRFDCGTPQRLARRLVQGPGYGSTVSGMLNGGTNCYVNASGSVASVRFLMDSTALNTDTTPADGMQCVLDTTKFATAPTR